MNPRRFHLYLRFLAACTLVLLAAGGLVTSTGSGLSVPDWPTSYGSWFPPMIGGIRFEHSHRVIAGFVGLLTLVMAVFAFAAEKRRWARRLALGALAAVAAQAILGGLTVIYLLPTAVSATHACLAQTFFCLILTLALVTSREWAEGARITADSRSLKRLLVITTSLVYLQLAAGAVVRHTHGSHGLPAHFILAALILLHALLVLTRIFGDAAVRARFGRHAAFLGGLVVAQVFLGFASFIFTRVLTHSSETPAGLAEVFFRTAHQTNGAVVLGGFLLLTLRVFRLVRTEAPATARAHGRAPQTESAA